MYRLLIVDDEPLDREGLQTDIPWEDFGFHDILLARGAKEALELAGRFPPDLVLSDIRMPGMDGLALCAKLRETLPGLRFIFISGYDDFDYARTALRIQACEYLLKPVDSDELERAVKKAVGEIEEARSTGQRREAMERELQNSRLYIVNDILSELVFQKYLDNADIVSRLETLGFDYLPGRYLLACLEIDGYDEFLEKSGVQKNKEICRAFCGKAEEYRSSRFSIQGGYLDLRGVLLMFSCREDISDRELIRKAEEVCEGIASSLQKDVRFSAGVSRVFGSLSAISDAYGSSQAALRQKFYEGPGKIHRDDTAGSPGDRRLDFENIDSELSKAALAGDEERVERLLDSMFQELERYQVQNAGYVQSLCINIVSRLCLTVSQLNSDSEREFFSSAELIQKLLRLETILNLKMWMKNIFRMAVQVMNRTMSNKEQIVADVLRYIEENYQEDITLKDIALNLHYSPNYVGNIFKKTFGKGFNDYLIEFRMQKAAELLRTRRITVFDLSYLVGYRSPSAFIKQFRRTFGTTPALMAETGESPRTKNRF